MEWIVYGQTCLTTTGDSSGVPIDGIDNPTPNSAGAIGEVASLPYQVPAGKKLRLELAGFEGNLISGRVPTFVLFVWLSDQPMPNAGAQERVPRALFSVAANSQSNVTPYPFTVPAGKYVNVRLLNDGAQARFGWFVSGELLDA